MTFDDFVKKYTGKEIDFELFWRMNPSMFSSSKNNKIFNPIVRFIMVNMVDYLITFKKSTKFLFYNESMFGYPIVMSGGMMRLVQKNILSFIRYATIPMIMIDSFIKSYSTTIRTKFSFTNSITFKVFIAFFTFLNALTRQIIASTTTHVRIIGWWSFKLLATPFANKYHNKSISYSMKGVNYL